MYFKDRDDTNIDDEFKNDNKLSQLLKMFSKYKIFVILGIIIILMIVMILLFINRKVTNYLILNGEEIVTLYQGSDYIELGFNAYNSKNEDLTNEVEIKSTLDTNKIGEYEIIYTLEEINKTRKVIIIEKPKEYTFIYLNTINNSVNVYLKINEEYKEPGYIVYSNTGEDLTNKVEVSGTVDTTKKGIYKLYYTIIDSNNVTITKTRNVIVMDTEISLSLDKEEYTNDSIIINVGVIDEYFDYLILPDGTEIKERTYTYKVEENGKYSFKTYNKKGMIKEATIEVKNIDRTQPNGNCVVDQNEKGSFITVTATDSSGIKKYEYNNQAYINSPIILSTYIENAKVKVYDKANNIKEITCTVAPKVFIKSIEKDGVIITINAKKVNNDIAGYYFSYTNKRPNKQNGGYISTNKESFDVVRLPGTTYVWVEDKVGKISAPKTITIGVDEILMTTGNDYKFLKGTALSTYLSDNGWSIEGLNNLIARSVRAAGLYSKEAAATSSLSLLHVLAQKYKIKLPYESAGIYTKVGAKSNWGSYIFNYITDTYVYSGMDCSAFVNWSYANAGYGIESRAYFWGGIPRVDFNKNNGEIGDVLVYGYGEQEGRHVRLIIGKTETAFITAEATGTGMVISKHEYSKPNNYKIQKSSNFTDLTKNKGYYKLTDYPSGF